MFSSVIMFDTGVTITIIIISAGKKMGVGERGGWEGAGEGSHIIIIMSSSSSSSSSSNSSSSSSIIFIIISITVIVFVIIIGT